MNFPKHNRVFEHPENIGPLPALAQHFNWINGMLNDVHQSNYVLACRASNVGNHPVEVPVPTSYIEQIPHLRQGERLKAALRATDRR